MSSIAARVLPDPIRKSHTATVESPVGDLLLVGDGEALSGILFAGRGEAPASCTRDQSAFKEARAELSAYFAGELRTFSLALAPQGTAFQRSVWSALCEIPYGATVTYGELALRLGREGAQRAVGSANAQNPIPIVLPCHRVIGKGGALTGYGGGLSAKRLLLSLESGQLNWMRGSANA